MADVGDDIDAKCRACGNATHVVVAKMGDAIASIECKQCGQRKKLTAKPSGRDDDRHADAAETSQLARWLFALGAKAPLERTAVEALAREHGWQPRGDDPAGGLRYRPPGVDADLIFDHAGRDMIQAFVIVAKRARRGKALDAVFAAVRGDVAAALGDPARALEASWALWRAPQALLFVVQIDDIVAQHGEAVALWLVPWTELALPALDANAADWILKRGRERRDATGS